ncbi:hypothetical protein HPP92_008839 [Vanilla planifolia]|uniref:J domain-containing protein n=1 Tax=Vanilla planifolia TaxID=51239 RepID=A0A835V450_VANPL|nr:hypothetical protein HPP92_009076 [Vanilla planifolia]KAG0486744.1 hypothetical protein HPP92_008839 [Vanilla planifolia]
MLASAFSIPLPKHVADPSRRRPFCSTRSSVRISGAAFTAASEGRATAAPPSFYEILGLTACATSGEIKAAYRRLARECHPDAAACRRKCASADEFMRVHDAYSTLSDPEKKADYDRKISAAGTTFRPSFSGGRRRTWETDQCW